MAGQVEDGGEYPSSVPATVDYRVSDRRGPKAARVKDRACGVYSRPSVFDGSFDIS